jgi:hypothetical protein
MTATQTDQRVTLIFQDQAGDYFLLPREVMEQFRAPAEQGAAAERSLALSASNNDAGADDTEAFALPLIFFAGMAVGAAATAVGTAVVVTVVVK